jgi:hypothetical protein
VSARRASFAPVNTLVRTRADGTLPALTAYAALARWSRTMRLARYLTVALVVGGPSGTPVIDSAAVWKFPLTPVGCSR